MSISANQSSVLASEPNDYIEEVPLLTAVNDDHEGVIVEMEDPMDSTHFLASLRKSLANWRKQGTKGVWIKLPIKLAHLVESAAEEGFWCHHAEPNYLMLVCWLPDTEHTIPANASHRIRVGAFVMNDKREVLVVQEKNGILRSLDLWKFPTGVIEQGEYIHPGVVREVKEETGIDTEFLEVLAFRQNHMSFFEKSDLFFICALRPLSHDIHPQELEIKAAQWMPVEEFAAHVQKRELQKHILDVCLAWVDQTYAGFSPVPVRSDISGKQGCLFLNSRNFK